MSPEYPRSAREEGVAGTVKVSYLVTEVGAVTDVRVVRSSGDARLDRSAVKAAEGLRYTPELRDGVPVRKRLVRTFSFVLTD